MNKTFKSLIIQSEVKFYLKLPTKMMHMTARLLYCCIFFLYIHLVKITRWIT